MNDNFMGIKQVNPVNETGTGADTSDIQTQIKILQSESLIERVVDKVKKDKPSTDARRPNRRISTWRRALNLPEPPPANPREDADSENRQRTQSAGHPQTRIIEITFDSTGSPGSRRFS